MRKILLCLTVSLFTAFPAWAELSTYTPVKEKSALKFFAIQNGAPLQGRFTEFSAEIKFDPEKPGESSIIAEVNTGSVEVSHAEVDKNIRLPEWLSVDKFPKATFKSKTITRMPNSDNYFAEGDLTLRGKKVPVTMNFQMERMEGNIAIAKGYITLRRSDFGIGHGEWAKDDVIKNEVRVEFRIYATRQ